jgi:single-strand DNA-binding protein
MIHAFVVGRLGRNPEPVKAEAGGCSFSVASDQGWGDKKSTNWVRVTIWGKRGEKLSTMLGKGSRVGVRGELTTREHEGKQYLELRADEVELLDGKPAADQGSARPQAFADDETPF